ncbi:hypothetical protein [Natronomonas sp.]|uniref:hypothetical protein n=1 Tax=Natronomonas sp. TaxID=2184060 RepID=UPI002FC3B3A7
MSDQKRDNESGPIGTMIGASLGPLGAAVGTVVDENRFALKFSIGTNADDDDGMDDATTIEIEDSDEEKADAEGEEAETDAEDDA